MLIRKPNLILQATQQPRCVYGYEVICEHCRRVTMQDCWIVNNAAGLVDCALNGAYAVCLQI